MALREGATFAGYRIIRLLGSGGMGEVYLAEHPRLPRRDALKILPADLCADPQFRARFTREASLAATLFHPHIVGVHDRGESAGKLWISFDHVDGPDTAALLRSRHPAGMPPTEALSILSAIGSALDYAHARGLLHRDVKPANILLTEDPADQRRILLADFGIARALADISTLTATNTAMGTLLYAAPEQLAGGPIDGRADQYSLAATAFHLLTGCAPDRHSPPAVSALRPELSAFDGPIQTALARDPAHRHRSCRHFLEELLAAAGPMEISSAAATRAAPVNTAAPVVPEPAPAVGPARQPGGKGRILAAGVALGLLAGAAVLGVSRSEIPADYPVAQSPLAQSPVAQSPVAQSLTPTTISVTATPVTSTVVAPPHTTTVTTTVTATPTATSTTSERTAPDAALITSAGWNACTRSYPWSSCLDAARDAAGAPWSAAPPLTGDGTWPVPQSARYGDYRAAVGPMGRCQWSGYDVLGRMVDSGTFDMRGAPAVATVSPTMASFQSFGCTPWFRVTPLN